MACDCFAGYYGARCQFAEDRELDASAMLTLDVVYGLRKRPGRVTSRHRGGKPRYGTLDLGNARVQEWVRDTCREARAKATLFVRTRNTICVLDVFEAEYLAPRGLSLPLPQDDLRRHLAGFAASKVLLEGQSLDHWIGIDCDTGEVAWLRDRFTLRYSTNANVDDREDLFSDWRKFLDGRGDLRPNGVSRPIMASDDEVMTLLEANILFGSVVSALVSVTCAFVCVLALTRAVFHTCLILAVVVWEMCCLVSFMTFALGWKIGIIEAISLSIFVGVSVDYVLHVDQAFRFYAGLAPNAPGERRVFSERLAQLQAALGEVGAPVFAAAFTTFASAAFLLFCLILPFHKLGVMICAHTALSCLAALTALPAVLLVVPQRRVSPQRPDDDAAFAVELAPAALAAPSSASPPQADDDAAIKKMAADAAAAAGRPLADNPNDEHKS